MDIVRTVWDFIQNQVLGMQWLQTLIGDFLTACGLDVTTRLGGSLWFFLYDLIKIMVLLGVLILLISYIQSYFPPERSRRISGRFHGVGANLMAALLGTVHAFLLLLIHSPFYGVYQRRAAFRGHLFLSHFLAYGGFGVAFAAHEYFRLENRHPLCGTGAGGSRHRRPHSACKPGYR